MPSPSLLECVQHIIDNAPELSSTRRHAIRALFGLDIPAILDLMDETGLDIHDLCRGLHFLRHYPVMAEASIMWRMDPKTYRRRIGMAIFELAFLTPVCILVNYPLGCILLI